MAKLKILHNGGMLYPLGDEIFYPADPKILAGRIDDLMDQAAISGGPSGSPQNLLGIAAPHAAYPFAGKLMARAYAEAAAMRPDWILLMAPVHGDDEEGIFLPPSRSFKTPLGEVEIFQEGRKKVLEHPGFLVKEDPYKEEFALELQLPFLRRLFPTAPALPLYVGGRLRKARKALAEGLKLLGKPPLTVVTTNLTAHEEKRLSRPKAEEILTAVTETEAFDPRRFASAIGGKGRRPCGFTCLGGLWEYRGGATALKLLDWGSGNPRGGDRERCTYYGAFRIEGEK